MIDQDKKREAMQRVAEHRQRAAQYEALSEESKQRGVFELSSKFASNAYEERNEARTIEDGVSVGKVARYVRFWPIADIGYCTAHVRVRS